MNKIVPVALALLALSAAPGVASQENYNLQSVSTTNSTTANCNASFMVHLCASTTTSVAAPLPALGAGVIGGGLLAAAAGLAFVVRHRRNRGDA